MGFMSTVVVWSTSFCESRILIDKFSKYFTYSVLITVLGIEDLGGDKVPARWSLHLAVGERSI